MSSRDWKRIKTATQHIAPRVGLHEPSETIDDPLMGFPVMSRRGVERSEPIPAPRVALVATLHGEFILAEEQLPAELLAAAETLVALCALLIQTAPDGEPVELEIKQDSGETLQAIAFDATHVFIDRVRHTTDRQSFRTRAWNQRATMR